MAAGTRPPTPHECLRILETYGVPDHIRRHSEQVARVARCLADALRQATGQVLDVERVVAGALLHDIAKADCFHNRRDHAQEGGRVLRGMGLDDLAPLVERHVELGPWDPHAGVTEAEILNYSDKRVRHEEVVTLEERFLDLLERYGRDNERAQARIRENWVRTHALEEKLFRDLSFGPEALCE